VAAAVATWGWGNVAIKATSTTGLVASFYRLWFAVPVLWLIAACVPSIRRGMNHAWLAGSLVGGTLFALHQILFFNSLKLTSVANVTLIGALQPAVVLMVAGRLFGERVSLRAILWSLGGLGGTACVIVASAGAPGWSPLGDALAVANLFAFTGYFLASKEVRSRVGTPEYMVGMTTVAGILITAAALITRQDLGTPTGRDLLILAGVAVIPGTLGHFLTNWAHPHTSAFVASIMLLAVPVIASVGAATFLDEALRPVQIAGGTIVLVSIGMVVRATHAPVRKELAGSAAETDAP
jgi:drug/metabolite transporter (DMT)-like permease